MPIEFNDLRIFVPSGCAAPETFSRITHLGIGAHQDDLEFHALHGILECWERKDRSFGGITCSDGAGSSRTGPYADFSDEQMQYIRREEQNAAAVIGKYGVMVQLDYPSSRVRDPRDETMQKDLQSLLVMMQPEVVYTHNLADKHETHVGVAMKTIAAIRKLPLDQRPARLLGFEGWRALDWLVGEDKIPLDVSAHPELAAKLAGVFDSQIAGGKRYDLAIDGRRASNATLDDPYASDHTNRVTFVMDMTPLILEDTLDPLEFTLGFVRNLENDIRNKLTGYL
jgi:LmbE family N-acetylglucosaminyl deacetylase